MGEIAASLILDMIEKERLGEDIDDIVVTPRLVVRQSSGPAPTNLMEPAVPGGGSGMEEP